MRLNASKAFLHPVAQRRNLAVVTEAQVTRLRLDGRRAVGVEFLRAGEAQFAQARIETVLAAGSIGSTQILQLSGIAPNIEYHVQPLTLDKFGDPLHPFPAFTASLCNLRPTSRGHTRISSADFRDAPEIQPNYLSTAEDHKVAADSLRLTRRIAQAPALARCTPDEFLPGPAVQSDEELERAAGDIGTTIFHPTGTCRMGRVDDPMAVVDPRLRLRGIERLRVVDASIMPTITSGNTAAPVMMIAERGAAMIRQDRESAA